MLTGLVDGGVAFVVVGGVAGGIHGSPFGTNDLDVCYATKHANAARLVKVVRQWSPHPRGWEENLPFTLDTRTFRTSPVLTLRTTQGDLDLLHRVEGVGAYPETHASSEEMLAFGRRFRVLTLDALIRARRASGRPKDHAQIPTLEALVELKTTDR